MASFTPRKFSFFSKIYKKLLNQAICSRMGGIGDGECAASAVRKARASAEREARAARQGADGAAPCEGIDKRGGRTREFQGGSRKQNLAYTRRSKKERKMGVRPELKE